MTDSDVDDPVYEAGRLEGHADIAARLRAILDPEDKYHWNIDGVMKAVEDNAKMFEVMRKELMDLRDDLRAEKFLREKAEANYTFMVKKAADQSLDGYRELGERCAQLAAERDEARNKLRGYESAPVHVAAHVLRSRLRETAQILIEVLGHAGPMDAEDAARKAAEVIERQRSIIPELQALATKSKGDET